MRLVIAAAAALMLFGATPAVAEVGEHCQEGGYCLFSGSDFTGTKANPRPLPRCQTAQSVGLDTIRSAARGYGDSQALTLYSDSACTQEIGNVFQDKPNVKAKSFMLWLLPS